MAAFGTTCGGWAQRTWAAPDDEARRLAWHHLVLAVGNFMRQPGYRLRPAPLDTVGPPDDLDYPAVFVVPGLEYELRRDDPSTWMKFRLTGSRAPTVTTLLAALWPTDHHVLDWRVLAAVVGLTSGRDGDLRLVEEPSTKRLPRPTMSDYPEARKKLLDVANTCDCLQLVDVERALYILTKQKSVGSNPKRTWRPYGDALLRAAQMGPSAGQAGDDGSADDEVVKDPDAP